MQRISTIVILIISTTPAVPRLARAREFCRDNQRCAAESLYICVGAVDGGRPTAVLEAGEEVEVVVRSDIVSAEVRGWSYAVLHDSSRLEILEVSTAGLSLPPFLFDTTTFTCPLRPGSCCACCADCPGAPPSGFASAVVLELLPPPGVTLAVGPGMALARARYRALERIDSGAPVRLEFRDRPVGPLDDAPTSTSFTIDVETRRPSEVYDALLGVMESGSCSTELGGSFSRGDCDGDGSLDLSDVIICLGTIFRGELSRFDCDDLVDVNDDGKLDATDPIALLSWLFLGSADLPPPFQGCGVDLTSDGLSCRQSSCG